MWSTTDLIVAPATPPGAGARAIVRLAGDGLAMLLDRLVAADQPGFAPPGGAARAVPARLAADGLGRDWGAVPLVVLHWPGPGGPAGGPLVELQLPCSAPLVAAVIAEACRHGARLAEGGEFTLRAFLAGRLDLLQAEAVLAVVEARTPDELSAALDRAAGGAGTRLRAIRDDLVDLLADVEAAIDFADETTPDSVPVADAAAWRGIAERLELVCRGLGAAAAGLAARDTSAAAGLPRVVLAGPPNVGKSSLFNALVGRDAALVADAAGTTRDWIEARLHIPEVGVACMLVDLAGLAPHGARPADGAIGAAADAAARAEIARADVVVVCHDAGGPDALLDVAAGATRILVSTRCDRASAELRVATPGFRPLPTSAVTGAGVASLRGAIGAAVAALPPRGAPVTARLQEGLAHARNEAELAAADVARAAAGDAIDEAIVAGRLRSAAAALSAVTGADLGGDLLDRIFARHCIGK